jgi:hypothetical protein
MAEIDDRDLRELVQRVYALSAEAQDIAAALREGLLSEYYGSATHF